VSEKINVVGFPFFSKRGKNCGFSPFAFKESQSSGQVLVSTFLSPTDIQWVICLPNIRYQPVCFWPPLFCCRDDGFQWGRRLF